MSWIHNIDTPLLAYGQMDPEGSWPTGADTTMASDWTPLACNDAVYARMGMA